MCTKNLQREKTYANLLDLVENIADGAGFEIGPVVGDDSSPLPDQSNPEFHLGPVVGDDSSPIDDNLEVHFSLGPVTGDDSSEQPPDFSDVRLKTDIEQMGQTNYGLPLYHFRYKTGTERFEGVMAQDVLEVMPGAVLRGADGFYRVNYGMLGLEMRRV